MKIINDLLYNYNRWLTVRQYSPRTIDVYMARVKKFILIYPEARLDQVTKQDIQNYLLKINKSVSYETVSGLHAALSNFFKFLRIAGFNMPNIIENPLRDFAPVKRAKHIPRVIATDELTRLMRAPRLNTMRGMRDYMIMMLLLHGLRASEVCNLNMDDIYYDGWGLSRRLLIHVSGKGLKDRKIVAETSGDTGWAWQKWQEKRRAVNCPAALPSCYRSVYRRMSRHGLYSLLKRYGVKTGVARTHPHAWRHTAAVRLAEDGINIKEIQIRLGHESIATTEKYVLGASILQEGAANSRWIHDLKKADLRHRRRHMR